MNLLVVEGEEGADQSGALHSGATPRSNYIFLKKEEEKITTTNRNYLGNLTLKKRTFYLACKVFKKYEYNVYD